MTSVFFKVLAFILMIALGYLMKARHILQQEDSQILMKIIINITMPAALISGFRTFSIDVSLLFALAIGFGMNLLLLAAGWICSVRKDGETRALYLLNTPSYNIGNFVLPFVQGFLPSSAVLCLCMYDAGNNPFGAGITYSAACSVSGGNRRLSIRHILRTLFRSPPFLAYFIMLVLYLPGIRLPDAFFDLCTLFGQGNGTDSGSAVHPLSVGSCGCFSADALRSGHPANLVPVPDWPGHYAGNPLRFILRLQAIHDCRPQLSQHGSQLCPLPDFPAPLGIKKTDAVMASVFC